MSEKNDNSDNDIKKQEDALNNGEDAGSLLGDINNLQDSNHLDPTLGDDTGVPFDSGSSDDTHSKSSEASQSSDKSSASSKASSNNDSSASTSSESSESSESSQEQSESESKPKQTAQPKGDVSQVDGNNKDAAEDLQGNNPTVSDAFSINPYDIIRRSKVSMENALDILEKNTDDKTKPSQDDMKKVYSLIRSAIGKQSTAFEYLETQMHHTLQKMKNSVKVVRHKQDKISDIDPKANLQMLNEMAKRGIPQRLDADFRMLNRILRNDPFFQKFKQENHYTSGVKPTKQFTAQTRKVKQSNVAYANRNAATKNIKSTTQSRN